MATTTVVKRDQRISQDRKFYGTGKLLGRERSKYLRQKFQQVVIQALLKKGEESGEPEVILNETESLPIMPKEIDTTLNLSKTNLKQFPNELLDKLQDVQYLYLEDSKLTELPRNFFQKLPCLKWLDLRNNALTSLPTPGLRNHPSLEVILLQGNRVRNLPTELATIPTLKGLQTTGNPLTNVPYDRIAEGFPGVIDHLRKLCAQNDILAPVSETILVRPSTSQDETSDNSMANATNSRDSDPRTWDSGKLSQWRKFMKKKAKNPNCDTRYSDSMSEKRMLQKPKVSVTVRSYPRVPCKPAPFKCGTYNRNRHRSTTSHALHNLKMKRTRLGYKKNPITWQMIEEKARENAYIAQVRETLEKQARKIQRMRDKEVLKSWREHARLTKNQVKLLDNYQQYPSKDFASKTPFDIDPEFLAMLNRVDLYRSLRDYDNRSRKVKKPKIRVTATDLERQMNEIIQKLQNLDTGDPEEGEKVENTKEFQMRHKMSKILDIQKTLKQLQCLNAGMPGITRPRQTKSVAP